MENFKLDIYKKETGDSFPIVESLSSDKTEVIINEIKSLIDISHDRTDIFIELSKKLLNKDFDEEFTYDIYSIFKEFNLASEEDNILIIWNKDVIDKFCVKVLLDKWNYIWYGDSDEAVILYQEESKKLLLITHYGRFFYN